MDKFRNKYRISSARLRTWNYGNNGYYFVTICTKKRRRFFGEIVNKEMNLNDMGKIAYACWEEIPNHFKFVQLGKFSIMPNHVHGIIIIDKCKIDSGENDSAEMDSAEMDSVEMDSVEMDPGDIDPENFDSVEMDPGDIDPENFDSVEMDPGDIDPENFDSVETTHALSLRLRLQLRLHQKSPPPKSQSSNSPPSIHFRFRNQGKKTLSSILGSYKSAVTKLIRRKCESGNLFGWQGRFHDHIIRSEKVYFRISEYIKNNPANWKEDKFCKP